MIALFQEETIRELTEIFTALAEAVESGFCDD